MDDLCANCGKEIEGMAYVTRIGHVCESCEEKMWEEDFKEETPEVAYYD